MGDIFTIFGLLSNRTPFAFSRFNDGEMMGVEKAGAVVARGDQVVDEDLSNRLREALTYRQENYFVGLPCPKCYPRWSAMAEELVGDYEFKSLATLFVNRNWTTVMRDMPDLIDKDEDYLIWVGGQDQNVLNLSRITGMPIRYGIEVPTKNAWSEYEIIKNRIVSLISGDYTNEKCRHIVMISAGPLSNVLIRDMYEEHPEVTFIDVGSAFDPYTKDLWHNFHRDTHQVCSICR